MARGIALRTALRHRARARARNRRCSLCRCSYIILRHHSLMVSRVFGALREASAKSKKKARKGGRRVIAAKAGGGMGISEIKRNK